MASTPTNSPQEQASAISAFADELQHQFSSSAASSGALAITDDVLRALDRQLEQLPLYRTDLPISTRQQLDLKGTEVWNTCVRLMTTCGEGAQRGLLSKGMEDSSRTFASKDYLLLFAVKLLAFGMLESVAPRRGSGNLRTLEIALKTARDCLDNGHLESSLKVLETAVTRLDTLERSGPNTDKSKLPIITTEYYTLRIYLSWLQERPDIAEHLFSKMKNTQDSQAQRIMSMEIYYTIGVSALSKNQFNIAVCWLERALESSLCPDQDIGQPDLAMKDMRLLTLHAFVRAHIYQNTANSRGHMLQALDSLKTEYRGIFPVVILQLEVLGKDAQPSYQEYFECLETAVRMMEPTYENLKIALYHIQKLKCWSWEQSMKMSQQILLEKFVPSNHRALVEQYFVFFVWMITDHCTSHDHGLDTIADTAKKLTESGNEPLSGEAVHASLVLIWRKIESTISTGDLCMAERWCCFVLEQPIFRKCSIANRSIIRRKLIICALDNPNTSLVHDTLNRMLEQSQDTPSTLYLVYRIALRHHKADIGTMALEALSKLGTAGTACLMSCAAETQRLGKTRQVMDCLQRAIATLDCGCHEGLNIPALFQNTICIISTEIERCKTENTELLEKTCNVFETALKHVSSTDNSVFSANEIEWLFQKSYNLSLQSVKTVFHGLIIRLLDISAKLADSYKHAPGLKDDLKLAQHYLSCNFLKVIILVTEARENTNPLGKGKFYHEIRNAIQHFRNHIQQVSDINAQARWQTSYRTLLSFDFEAAILLDQHDSLPSMIEECHTFVDGKLCTLFLDSILASDAPISVMARVVMTIINTLHTSSSPSLNKTTFQTTLPRYLRCLFQLSIQANEFPLAEAILDKSLSLARENNTSPPPPSNGKKAHHYPNEELEWLATMAFNRAVDFYLASADEDCKRWAGKAIEIADEVRYNHGALGRLLRENLAKLP